MEMFRIIAPVHPKHVLGNSLACLCCCYWHRLETALDNVPRERLISMADEIGFEMNCTITRGEKAQFKQEWSEQCSDKVEKMKEELLPYIVRTVFQDQIQRYLSVALKRAQEEMKKKKQKELFDAVDMHSKVNLWRQKESNYFFYSTMDTERMYRYFCYETTEAAKKVMNEKPSGRKPKKAQKNDEEEDNDEDDGPDGDNSEKAKKKLTSKESVEQYVPILVMSEILEELFQEDFLQTIFEKDIKVDSIADAFGATTELSEVKKRASRLEASKKCLPFYNIDPKAFRRVFNVNLAATAAFLAMGIYDEDSLRIANVLVSLGGRGEPMPTWITKRWTDASDPTRDDLQVYRKIKDKRNPLDDDPALLFEESGFDDGKLFVAATVNVATRFHSAMDDLMSYIPPGSKKGLHSKLRLRALLYRTLCSSIMDLYVHHGMRPYYSNSILVEHPQLKNMLHHYYSRSKRVIEIILEFILVAVKAKAMEVHPSHCYKSDGKLVTYDSYDSATPKQPTRGGRRVQRDEPSLRNIRYIFNVRGAIKELPSNGEDPHLEPNLNGVELHEVVSLLLLGTTRVFCSFEKIQERDVRWYDWSTRQTMPVPLDNKKREEKVPLYVSRKKEAKEQQKIDDSRDKTVKLKETEAKLEALKEQFKKERERRASLEIEVRAKTGVRAGIRKEIVDEVSDEEGGDEEVSDEESSVEEGSVEEDSDSDGEKKVRAKKRSAVGQPETVKGKKKDKVVHDESSGEGGSDDEDSDNDGKKVRAKKRSAVDQHESVKGNKEQSDEEEEDDNEVEEDSMDDTTGMGVKATYMSRMMWMTPPACWRISWDMGLLFPVDLPTFRRKKISSVGCHSSPCCSSRGWRNSKICQPNGPKKLPKEGTRILTKHG